MKWPRPVVVAIVCCAAGSAQAEGATVGLAPHPEPVYGNEFRFVAASGEVNRVRVRQLDAPFGTFALMQIHDAGAAVVAGDGCTQIDEHTVRCTDVPGALPVWGVRLLLGDEDDRVAPLVEEDDWPTAVAARGGPGDDHLEGGSGLDDLDGGDGRDVVRAGPGDDIVSGGDRTRRPVSDVIDGGAGTDTVSYERRRRPVSVDLALSEGGAAGENDRVTRVEHIRGGLGDDRLAGDSRSNLIDGQAGRDVLIGRGGEDRFRSGGRSISCGPGDDFVQIAQPAMNEPEYMEPDCEAIDVVHRWWWLWPHPTSATRRAVGFELACPWDGEFDDPEQVVACAGTVRVRDRRGRLLAHGGFPNGRWQARQVKARLTALGRRLASRLGGVRARVYLTLDDGTSVMWSVQLTSLE